MRKQQTLRGGFARLRPVQEQMVADMARIRLHGAFCAPTGCGKTLAYMTAVDRIRDANRISKKAVILTQTKHLQDQIRRDFAECADLRGAVNFRCSRWGSCAVGRLHECSSPDCPYMAQFAPARRARDIVTNYSFWLHSRFSPEVIPDVGLLVCDEAHMIDSAITSVMSAELPEEASEGVETFYDIIDLAKPLLAKLNNRIMQASNDAEQEIQLRRSRRILHEMLTSLPGGEQILVERHASGVRVCTVFPYYWMQFMIEGLPYVLLVSATLSRQSVEKLLPFGDYYEYPSPFDPRRSPVYLWPRGRLSWKQDESVERRVFDSVAKIAMSRPGARGIIHTVSYTRGQKLKDYWRAQWPEAAARVVFDRNAKRAHALYMAAPDSILISPAVGAGYDFPDDACRWQVILKAPYPDLGSPIVRARCELDASYAQRAMMDALVQACGRHVRHAEDYGETFVVDSAACEALCSPEAPQWLRARVRHVGSIPKPLAVPECQPQY